VFISLFILVPLLLTAYKRLKETQKPTYFSEVVILSALLFSLLAFAYLAGMRYSMNYEQYLNSEILQFVVGLALIFLTSALFLPKTFSNFKNWKKTKKSIYFSGMMFFAFMSFYCLSVLFLKLIISALGMFVYGR